MSQTFKGVLLSHGLGSNKGLSSCCDLLSSGQDWWLLCKVLCGFADVPEEDVPNFIEHMQDENQKQMTILQERFAEVFEYLGKNCS